MVDRIYVRERANIDTYSTYMLRGHGLRNKDFLVFLHYKLRFLERKKNIMNLGSKLPLFGPQGHGWKFYIDTNWT